ncbi:MAG: hypothetical protein AB7Q97_03055 [Gammaproteobacteria bacterium]
MSDARQRRVPGLTTAYAHNALPRPQSTPDPTLPAPIARLRVAGHVLLDETFGTDGVFFRALATGFDAGLEAGAFAFNDGAHPLCALERELGVYLVSHVLSDALAIARPWEDPPDAAILVIPARHFAAAAGNRRAGMLAFAEPGVVFRYPFLVDPVPLAEVAIVIAGPGLSARLARDPRAAKPAAIVDAGRGSRAQIEARLLSLLAGRGLRNAHPVACRAGQ